MATRGPGRSQQSGNMYTFEPLDKLASSTLKRHPKMELNKTDLLKLLSVLEAELQAREIVIAVLKAEQVKQLLYPKRKHKKAFAAGADPLSALQRDVFGAFDPNFDETAVKQAYNAQLHQLELLIAHQRKAQDNLREQLQEANEQYAKAIQELDEERRKHAQDTAQGDDVTYLLEKERERLRQEVDFERQQNKRLEKEAQRLSDTLEEERLRQKQIVLLLLAERKRLVLRLLEEKQQAAELSDILNDEKNRMADMVEGLEEESKKSLQMEAEMERQLSEFDYERESYKVQLSAYDLRNQELLNEIERLQIEMEGLKQQLTTYQEQKPPLTVNLGEGVRSTIVTMVTTPPTLRAIPTVTPTISPPRSVAKPVSPKSGITSSIPLIGGGNILSSVTSPAPATPAKPPGLVAHVPPKMAIGKPVPAHQPLTAVPITLATPLTATTVTLTKSAKSALKITTPALPPRSVSPSPPQAVSSDHALSSDSEAQEEISPITSTGCTSVSAAVKLFAGQALLKGTSNASGPPSRKSPGPAGRGNPPPVPPNKPILPPQSLHRKDIGPKPPVPPRGAAGEVGEGLTSTAQRSPRALASIIKPSESNVVKSVDGHSVQVSTADNWSPTTNMTTSSGLRTSAPTGINATTNNANQQDQNAMEILGQELADFQQLFVSMANGQWPEVM